METTTISKPSTSTSEPVPNPLGLKEGNIVVMDSEYENPVSVIIESIGVRGFSANVKEIATGVKWSVTITSLSRS